MYLLPYFTTLPSFFTLMVELGVPEFRRAVCVGS